MKNLIDYSLKVFVFLMMLFVALTILSCGSRKVNLNKENTDIETQTEAEETMATNINQKALSISDIKISSDELNFDIEPIGGIPANFLLYYKGEKIMGHTTGKIHISNKKQDKNIQNKVEEQKNTKEEKTIKKEENKTEKKAIKAKSTERKTDWRIAVGFILVIVAIGLVYKIRKR